MQLEEEAWNATHYCKTVITNPGYMKDSFKLILETYCLPDRGESENVHELDADQLAKRQVIHVDIANDPIPGKNEQNNTEVVYDLFGQLTRGDLSLDFEKLLRTDAWTDKCENSDHYRL